MNCCKSTKFYIGKIISNKSATSEIKPESAIPISDLLHI